MTNEIPLVPLLESGSNRRRSSFVLAALALSSIAVVYVVTIVQLHPSNLFGLTGDDGIYMSSAKALAEGKGYVMPNLPGSPPATKYPVFYPWILSFVWRLNPVFPANLPLAIAVSVAFGVGFLMAAFAMFSSLGGFSRREALVLTAYLGLHPLVMFFGASVLSEMPFAFLALASMTVAERFMRPNERQLGSVCSGALAGLSVLTRILGFPILLGILVTGVVRRSWRQLATFVLTAAPFVGARCMECDFLQETGFANHGTGRCKPRLDARVDVLHGLCRNLEGRCSQPAHILGDVAKQRRNDSSTARGLAARTNICARYDAGTSTDSNSCGCSAGRDRETGKTTRLEANSFRPRILRSHRAALELSCGESLLSAVLAVACCRCVVRRKACGTTN